MTITIYLLTNTRNGKRYVGQTRRPLHDRLRHHAWASTAIHTRMPVASAIAKYGWTAFSSEVLATTEKQDEADRMELHFAKTLPTFVPHGYNLKAGNGPGALSADVRARIGAAHRGKHVTSETRARLSASHMGIGRPEHLRRADALRYMGQSVSSLGPPAAARKLAKSYSLVNPFGESMAVHNLKLFCRERGLPYIQIWKVATGRRRMAHGWTGRLLMDIRAEVVA